MQRYVSRELTHFVGRDLATDDERYLLLAKILNSGWLTHPPHSPEVSGNLNINSTARICTGDMYSPQVVCFCDIPVNDLSIHMHKYSRFGLSFLKRFLVQKGANPVFYVASNSRVLVSRRPPDMQELREAQMAKDRDAILRALFDRVPRSDHFDTMLPEYHDLFRLFGELVGQHQSSPGVTGDRKRLFDLEWFLNFQVFSFMKCFDDSRPDEDPENFYMEREWRLLGNLSFALDDVHRAILPHTYAPRLRKDVPAYVGQVTFVEESETPRQ